MKPQTPSEKRALAAEAAALAKDLADLRQLRAEVRPPPPTAAELKARQAEKDKRAQEAGDELVQLCGSSRC